MAAQLEKSDSIRDESSRRSSSTENAVTMPAISTTGPALRASRAASQPAGAAPGAGRWRAARRGGHCARPARRSNHSSNDGDRTKVAAQQASMPMAPMMPNCRKPRNWVTISEP